MSEWKVKRLVRTLYRGRCVWCDRTDDEHRAETGRRLHVHRTTPGSPYTVEGCVLLCKSCHDRAHAEMKPDRHVKARTERPRKYACTVRIRRDDTEPLLDLVAADLSARTGLPCSRSDVVRLLVKREADRVRAAQLRPGHDQADRS